MAEITRFDSVFFLGLFDRILDEEYLRPLKKIGPGYEVLQAYAEIFARLSDAVVNLDEGRYTLTAQGGAKATAVVSFRRTPAAAALALTAMTVKAGTIVTTSNGGRDFVLIEDVVWDAGEEFSGIATVEALIEAWEWNVPGRVILSDGSELVGDIDTVKLPLTDPLFQEPDFWAYQTTDATGGRAPMLDQIGADRGIPRRAQESDSAYRAKISQLPDTVSPDALRRAVEAALSVFSYLPSEYQFIETFSEGYQTCWDSPGADFLNFDSDLFAYDDPRSTTFVDRWLDQGRGEIIVVVPYLEAVFDVGMAYDDIAMEPIQHTTPRFGGRRSYSAYDVPGNFSDTFGIQGGYDGFDLPKQGFYAGLNDLLQEIKPGGVEVSLELKGT